MCWFVTVGVRHRGKAGLEALASHGLGVTPCTNASLRAIFPADDSLYVVTHAGCSCDLVPATDRAADEERRRDRWRKRGWSDAKIERALEASRAVGSHGSASGTRPIVQLVLALEQQVQLCRRVHVHAHFYSGDVQEASVPRPAAAKISIADLHAARGAFPTDTLVEIHRDEP